MAISLEDLVRIEAVAEAASPGPWVRSGPYSAIIAPQAPDLRGDTAGYGGTLVAESVFVAGDVEFITEARTVVPALVAEVRRLQALIAELESQLENLPR